MQTTANGSLAGFQGRLIDYLPTLTAGLFVVVLGIVVGWLVKRAVIRLLLLMRLDRMGGPFAWRAAFREGDVRQALYEIIGNVSMALVILLCLDNATQIWGLAVVSRLIDATLIALPNLALVGLIVLVGVLLSNSLDDRVEHTLAKRGWRIRGSSPKGSKARCCHWSARWHCGNSTSPARLSCPRS